MSARPEGPRRVGRPCSAPPRSNPKCGWCGQLATGLDDEGDPECARCHALDATARGVAPTPPVARLEALCRWCLLPSPQTLAARYHEPLAAYLVRAQWRGLVRTARDVAA